MHRALGSFSRRRAQINDLGSVRELFDANPGEVAAEAEEPRRDVALQLAPIGATAANLKSAIAGETHEYTDMYPGMAKTARDEDFDEIADWFETLAKAERSHANRFQKALDTLDK